MTEGKAWSVSPAQRLADLIVDQRKLQPPVPVAELVREIAEVKEVRLRGTGLDAVLHGLTADSRPTLLIDEDAPPTRQLFTLGHEFGHLSMAWHRGTLSCLVGDPEHGDDEPERSERDRLLEREANQFASRLLIPRRFVESLEGRNLGQVVEEVERTGVSAEAALYGIVPHLPVGRLLILMDYSGREIFRYASSEGTVNLNLRRGARFDEEYLDPFMEASGHVRFGGSHIYWGHLIPEMGLTVETAEWRPILVEILADRGWDASPSGALWRSINGVASAAHSDLGHESPTALAQRIRQVFRRHEKYRTLVEHARFDDFASSRALAFAAPKRRRK
ncbi:MAG: hypothetical protein CMH84_00210 [Nocardioides sp.]|nr:hypothetical protein [Nocardioides sp.]